MNLKFYVTIWITKLNKKTSQHSNNSKEKKIVTTFFYLFSCFFTFESLINWFSSIKANKIKKVHPRSQIINLDIQLVIISSHLEHHPKISDGWILYSNYSIGCRIKKILEMDVNIKLKIHQLNKSN